MPAGFANLSRLVSRAYLEGETGSAAAQLDWLERARRSRASSASPAAPRAPSIRYSPTALDAARCRAARPAARSCSATGSTSSCSATAASRRQPTSRSSSTTPTAAACRWSRPTSRSSRRRGDFEAHDALLAIAGGTVLAQTERRKLTAAALLQVARRDGGAFRGSARGARTTRSRSPSAPATGRKTRGPILPRFAAQPGQSEEEGMAAEAERAARRGARGAQAPASSGSASSRASPRAGLRRAARVRARRHHQDEVPGLLPDRRRLHPVGQGARHSGRARAAARAPARWSPIR